MRCSSLLLIFSLVASPLPAQVVLSLRAGAVATDPEPGVVLQSAYRLNLRSEWPQLSSAGCINGGQEQITGRLVRTAAGDYAGDLERSTTILFCGAHGQVREVCQLTLRSRGAVEARGDAWVTGSAGLLRLHWTTLPGSGAPAMSGDCPEAFAGKVEQMYLAVVHGLEFPLPGPGEAMRGVRLEDYGWVIDIQGEDR